MIEHKTRGIRGHVERLRNLTRRWGQSLRWKRRLGTKLYHSWAGTRHKRGLFGATVRPPVRVPSVPEPLAVARRLAFVRRSVLSRDTWQQRYMVGGVSRPAALLWHNVRMWRKRTGCDARANWED
jgi:hypothetical protein